MRQQARSAGGWFAAACLCAGAFWACSGSDTNPFGKGNRQQGGSGGTSGVSGGGASGSSAGTDSGSSGSGGTSGASGGSTGGDATGGMTTGGTTNEGGEAGDGSTTGGAAGMGGTSGAGMGGSAGTPATGGAGMSGSPMGGAGASAGAGMGGGGAGVGGGGMSGTGGMPGVCRSDGDCVDDVEYCRKESCDAETGHCQERGPACVGNDAVFDPLCGCDGITYWNRCVIEREGFNVAMAGECTGNNRPTCTRTAGGDSCPARGHVHCYRPVDLCGDPSPTSGVCWVLPTECPENEPQDQRYCGGTDPGGARCIGLCEVINAENSFRRDAPQCN